MKWREVAEREVVGERGRVGRHRGVALVPGGQLGHDPRRRRADVVHVQLDLGQPGDERGQVGHGCLLLGGWSAPPRRSGGTGTPRSPLRTGYAAASRAPSVGPEAPATPVSSSAALTGRNAVPSIQRSTGCSAPVAGQQVHVRSLPGVHRAARAGQQARRSRPASSTGASADHVADGARERALGGDRAQRPVRRRVEVARHLHGQPGAGRQRARPSGRAAPRCPGTHCRAALVTTTSTSGRGLPVAHVADREVDRRAQRRRLARSSRARSRCRSPGRRASARPGSAVSSPGPQPRSTTAPRLLGADPGHQVEERAGPLGAEAAVDGRDPTSTTSKPYVRLARHA